MLEKIEYMYKKEPGTTERIWALESERSGTKSCPCYFWDLLPNIIPERSSSKSGNKKESINASSHPPSQQAPSISSPLIHEPGE